MSWPLAYLLTWTTFGTRLHGDARGSVDLWNNKRRAPLLRPDAARQSRVKSAMSAPECTLNSNAHATVEQAVRDHAVIRNWEILALNARSNHVHVVADCRAATGSEGLVSPERVVTQFKTWGTRRFVAAGFTPQGRHLWTDHGSTRWINHKPGLSAAIEYVSNRQDDPDRFVEQARLDALHARMRELDNQWRAYCAARRAALERGEKWEEHGLFSSD